MLALMNNFLLANAAEDIVHAVQVYVGPILLLVISVMALKFLFKTQMMQFGIFVLVAILVAILFYAPGVIKTIAQAFAGETGLEGTGGNW